MADQIEEFFPGDDYKNLRQQMEQIGPKFDNFFLALYITDWVRIAAASLCSFLALIAYCVRYELVHTPMPFFNQSTQQQQQRFENVFKDLIILPRQSGRGGPG